MHNRVEIEYQLFFYGEDDPNENIASIKDLEDAKNYTSKFYTYGNVEIFKVVKTYERIGF